jgi:asparagine synthase (glutamine-hydrolysing)
MCGIFGTAIDNLDPQKALAGLAHRGPDDKGEWRRDGVLLCQTRLSIIDLSSGGHQPMLNDRGDMGIVFNGEIYNYSELKGELESQGVNFRSQSDTEVILKGFEKYGDQFFSKLRGMWAVAIFDEKKNLLTLSRDQFGIKPIFYSFIGGKIIFGSEVKSLIPYLPKVSPNSDEYFLFYNLGYFPGESTSFKEIKKVRPGEVFSIDLSSGAVARSFIELPIKDHQIDNPDEAVRVIQAALADSVKSHFIADVPVGLLLSGGNDSSLIAALAKEVGQSPICFNVSIAGSLDNNYAEKVANHLGLPYERINLTRDDFVKQYQQLGDILDQPTSDTSFLPTSLVYSAVKGKSKVVLSGEGGDELLGGYLRHRSFAAFSHMSFNNFFPDFSSVSKYSLDFVNPVISKIRNITSSFESLGSNYLYQVRQLDLGVKQRECLEFMMSFYLNHPYREVIQANLFFDLFMYIPDSLMYKGDMASMAYAIEGRVPFLDKEFFKTISAISPRLRLSPEFSGKRIMKMAMEKYLPKDLIYRKKTGFGLNISNYKDLVVNDLTKAITYHCDYQKELGISGTSLEAVVNNSNADVLLRKYPRFAFSLITNYQVCQRYLK